MTRDTADARRLWRYLYEQASTATPQRHHPPADFVRFDLVIDRADLLRLNDAVAHLQRTAERRLSRAEVGRAILARAIRQLASEPDYKPRKRGRPRKEQTTVV